VKVFGVWLGKNVVVVVVVWMVYLKCRTMEKFKVSTAGMKNLRKLKNESVIKKIKIVKFNLKLWSQIQSRKFPCWCGVGMKFDLCVSLMSSWWGESGLKMEKIFMFSGSFKKKLKLVEFDRTIKISNLKELLEKLKISSTFNFQK
jgi:hypothetical protein